MPVMIALGGEILLDQLSASTRARLAELAKRSHYSNGELIHSRGDEEPGMGIVISGCVRICRIHPGGTQQFVNTVKAGEHYGDGPFIAGSRFRTHHAIAQGKTTVDHYDKVAFEQILEEPGVMRALYRITARRLRDSMAMSDNLRSLSPEVHLAKILLAQARQNEPGAPVICVQEDLAGLLGVSSMTLSKCLAMLKQDGLIETGYRRIRVLDLATLRNWIRAREI